MNVFGRIDRALGRVNRWLAPAAVAQSAENTGSGSSSGATTNAVATTAVLGEIDAREREEQGEEGDRA